MASKMAPAARKFRGTALPLLATCTPSGRMFTSRESTLSTGRKSRQHTKVARPGRKIRKKLLRQAGLRQIKVATEILVNMTATETSIPAPIGLVKERATAPVTTTGMETAAVRFRQEWDSFQPTRYTRR